MEKQKELAAGLDCARFLSLAEKHRITSLVWYSIRKHPASVFEHSLRSNLAEKHRKNIVNQLAITFDTIRLHNILQHAGIPYCLLKGQPIEARYYRHGMLREAGDIDILIEGTTLDTVCKLLLAAGYHIRNPIDQLFPLQRKYFLFIDNQLEVEAPGSGTTIELHWRPLQAVGTLPAIDLRQQKNRWLVGGHEIPFLNDEETLLYLCAHGAKHAWYRLKWVFDLPQVLKSREWDWASLLAKAEAQHCMHEFLLGLSLAQAFSDWIAPPLMQASLQKFDAPKKYFPLIAQAIVKPDHWLNTPIGILKRNHYLTRFHRTPKDWLYHLASLTTNRRDWDLVPLPNALFPFYFILSPFANFWHLGKRFRKLSDPKRATPES